MIKEHSPAGVTYGLGFLRRFGLVPAPSLCTLETEQSAAGVETAGRPLNRLMPGECEVVYRVAGSGAIRQRLLELGVTPGATVEVIRFAPLGDPMEVRVRGYHLSLRRREAAAIWVRRKDRKGDGTDTPGTAPRRAGGQSK